MTWTSITLLRQTQHRTYPYTRKARDANVVDDQGSTQNDGDRADEYQHDVVEGILLPSSVAAGRQACDICGQIDRNAPRKLYPT